KIPRQGMKTVKYQLTTRELVLTGTLRKLGRIRVLVGISLILLAGIALLTIGDSLRILGWFLIFYVLLFPVLMLRAVHQQIKSNPVLTSKTTLNFSQSGVVLDANGIKSERSWNSLRSWSHSNNYFFLHTDSLGTAVTIPKRAFSEKQLELF